MRITRLSIQNYNAIGNASINFDKLPPLTMIAGRVKTAGASSNGAGKSSVFGALVWALYGKDLRSRQKFSVLRRGSNECVCEATVLLDNNKVMTVRRSRLKSGAVTVMVDGTKIDTATGGQELIESRLGFSYDLFCRTVVFAGDMSAFCRMSPADRTLLFEDMLGIGRYLKAGQLANQRRAEANAIRETTATKLSEAKSAYRSAREETRLLLSELASTHADYQRDLRSGLRDVRRLYVAYSDACAAVGDAKTVAQEQDDTYAEKKREWGDNVRQLRRQLEASQETVFTHKNTVAMKNGLLSAAEQDLSNATRNKHPDVCPTCRQRWPSVTLKPIDTTPIHAKIRETRDQLAQAIAVLAKARDEHAAAQSSLRKLELLEPQPPRVDPTMALALTKCGEAKAEFFAAVSTLESLREIGDPSDRHADRFNRLVSQTIGYKRSLRDIRRDAAQAAHTFVLSDYWSKGFGREGIPAILLDSAAPALTTHAKKYADILTDGAYVIKFVYGSTRGRGDFKVDVENIDGGESYADLSKGEQARVDLCVLLAIRDFMQDSAKVKCPQIFLDEIMDGVDPRGTEKVIGLLRSTKLASQVVYVSFASPLQEAADAVLLVEKKDGESTIRLQE